MELMKNSELLIFQIIWLEFSVIYITILGMIKSFLKESKEISDEINKDSYSVLSRIDERLVVDTLKTMKPNKKDYLYDSISDMYIDGPKEIIKHLTKMIQMFVFHGRVPHFILICSLLPLLKNNLGDSTSSENYRAIAGGCLLLKLIDMIILLVEREKLGYNTIRRLQYNLPINP